MHGAGPERSSAPIDIQGKVWPQSDGRVTPVASAVRGSSLDMALNPSAVHQAFISRNSSGLADDVSFEIERRDSTVTIGDLESTRFSSSFSYYHRRPSSSTQSSRTQTDFDPFFSDSRTLKECIESRNEVIVDMPPLDDGMKAPCLIRPAGPTLIDHGLLDELDHDGAVMRNLFASIEDMPSYNICAEEVSIALSRIPRPCCRRVEKFDVPSLPQHMCEYETASSSVEEIDYDDDLSSDSLSIVAAERTRILDQPPRRKRTHKFGHAAIPIEASACGTGAETILTEIEWERVRARVSIQGSSGELPFPQRIGTSAEPAVSTISFLSDSVRSASETTLELWNDEYDE